MSAPRIGIVVLALLAVLAIPSSAAATHVGCGDTITRDTTLDSDLVGCPGDGIVIGATGITLDLGGHTVEGDGIGCCDSGIANGSAFGSFAGFDRVTIKNGVVRDFSRGVTSYFASHNEIRGLYISGGFAGVSDVGGRNHIERNTISNVDTAIGLFSNDNFVAHNTLSHNERGVNIDGGSGNEIRHNQLFDNGFGIFITDSPAANRVAENAVSASLEGIRLNEASRGHVEHNLVQANTIGIHLASSYFVQIVGNRALENQDGILVAGELDGEGNVLARNRTSRNADDGIEVDNPGITVVRNVADHNGDLGIEAVAGVIDGGKNRAFGNGNPLQCLNVSCK